MEEIPNSARVAEALHIPTRCSMWNTIRLSQTLIYAQLNVYIVHSNGGGLPTHKSGPQGSSQKAAFINRPKMHKVAVLWCKAVETDADAYISAMQSQLIQLEML